jgi:hypothetical protein
MFANRLTSTWHQKHNRRNKSLAIGVERMEPRCMLAAGVLVVPAAVLTTSEDGGSATIRIKLTKQPTDDVTIPLSSSNPREGTISQSQVAFTPLNWNVFQVVRVTGQPDGVKDGVKTYRIVTGAAASNDPLYSSRAVDDAIVRNKDSTTLVAKIKVAPLTGQTSELGRASSFRMVLGYKPIADVVIPLSSTKPSAGTPNVSAVTFTTANWNVPQTIVVTGHDDGIFNGDVFYKIATNPATSTDPLYSGMNTADVLLRNHHRGDIGRFNGAFTGWYSGTITVGRISAPLPRIPLALTIDNSVIQITTGGFGSGRITTAGAVGFGLTSGSVPEGSFIGRVRGVAGTTAAIATGTFAYYNHLLGRLRVHIKGKFEVRCPYVAGAVRG